MYDPENNPYAPGDPGCYDLKWIVDRLNEHKFAEESAEEAKASAEAAAASAQEASGYADDAEGYADDAHGYADDAADYAAHIADPVSGLVTSWLTDHITNPSNPPIDTSLSVGGAAADAAVTGKVIRELDNRLTFTDWNNSFLSADLGQPYGRLTRNDYISLYPSPTLLDSMIGLTVICPAGYVAQIFYFDASLIVLARTDYNEINRLDVPENAVGFNIVIAKHLADTIPLTDADNILIIKETKAAMYENSLINLLLSSTEKHGCYDLDFTGGNIVQGITNPNGTGAVQASSTRCTDAVLNEVQPPYRKARPASLIIDVPNNIKYRVTFWTTGTPDPAYLIATDSNSNWQTGPKIEIPAAANCFKFSWAYTNNSTIVPTDLTGISIKLRFGDISNLITDEYAGLRMSILGDSISTFAGIGAPSAGDGHLIADGTYTYAGNHCRYPNGVITSVDMMYWKKLIDALDIKLGINDSWAGSRITWNGTESSDQGANIYIASQTRIDHLDDNGTPDIILVNAGTNDIGALVTIGSFDTTDPKNLTPAQIAALPVNTFADAMKALLIRLEKTYPTAKIIFMLPNYTNTYYSITSADSYCEVIKEACDFFGIPWFDCRTIGINIYNVSTYLSDGIHYNQAGMSLLYRNILKYMAYNIGI